MLMQYSNTIEKFQDLDKESPKIDLNILNDKKDDDKLKESKEGLAKLLKQVNGGIKLTENDLKETTDPINVDIKKYSDDNTPNALKIAQKETYELMNTVSALKDTITTLAPVLQEGKKLMNMFENIKL
jgi:superfamily II RNA helicase